MRIHFFNPGYEASFIRNSRHYTPSKLVSAFRKDLATLPLYYKDDRDLVLIPEELPLSYHHLNLTTKSDDEFLICPWGWAPELIGLFGDNAIPYSVDEMKRWCSRRLSVELWHQVHELASEAFLDDFPPMIIEDIMDLEMLKPHGRQWVLKDEFASSGRGVQFANSFERLIQLIEMRKSKGKTVFLESYYPKIEDRGYEFIRDPKGNISYLGACRFTTREGNYQGHEVLPPEVQEKSLSSSLTIPSHDDYIQLLTESLSRLDIGAYEGLLGVDTLVYKDDNGLHRLAPCIEINCRPTMGHLALALGRKYLQSNQVGYFFIHSLTHKPLSSSLSSHTPLYALSSSPIKSGLYPLTPITSSSQFLALLNITTI